MTQFILANAAALRLIAFVATLAAMLAWEALAPWRPAPSRWRRWTANFGLAAIDTALLRLLLPAAAVGAAAFASANGFGVFNGIAAGSGFAAFALSVVLLDLALWVQHLATHKVPLLWRLHRVHHSDVHIDSTTGVRFHPAEIVLSMLYKMAVVIVLGAPAAAVVTFEILLNAASLFNHGNVRLPTRLDALLRWLIVTPDFHRVHHSLRRVETDSNYGFCLSLWDRLFGTYRAAPADGLDGMTIGLGEFRAPSAQGLAALLTQPLLAARAPEAEPVRRI